MRKDKEKTLEYNRNYSKIYYQRIKELMKQNRLEKESQDSFSHINKSSSDDLFIEQQRVTEAEPEAEPEEQPEEGEPEEPEEEEIESVEQFKKQLKAVQTKLKERIKMITKRYGNNEYRVDKEAYYKNPDKVLKQIKKIDESDDETSYI